MEIWKKIKDFPDYEVSNLGRVKSLKKHNEKILKLQNGTTGYLTCVLCKDGKLNTKKVHKLVAIAFLNHIPNGYKSVINHKNFNKKDNRVQNLEITTQRENANRKHCTSSSKYVGVTWNKKSKKWYAQINFNCKTKYLGSFDTEELAYNAYLIKLNEIK